METKASLWLRARFAATIDKGCVCCANCDNLLGMETIMQSQYLWQSQVASALWLVGLTVGAAAQQDPKDIIASQLRSQGFACDKPKSATRDTSASKPYETVWIVACENATYRTTLVPNMAAQVEVIESGGER
jgi:hypothetical protein